MKTVVCKTHPNVVGLPSRPSVGSLTKVVIELLNLKMGGDETIKKITPIKTATTHF